MNSSALISNMKIVFLNSSQKYLDKVFLVPSIRIFNFENKFEKFEIASKMTIAFFFPKKYL